jgi:hypothetical protein
MANPTAAAGDHVASLDVDATADKFGPNLSLRKVSRGSQPRIRP